MPNTLAPKYLNYSAEIQHRGGWQWWAGSRNYLWLYRSMVKFMEFHPIKTWRIVTGDDLVIMKTVGGDIAARLEGI